MPTSRKALILAVVILAAFLFGYIPQHSAAAALRQQLDSCSRRLEFAALKNAIGLTYVAVTEKNYGEAAKYATRFFDRARLLAAESQNSSARPVLQNVLSQRDKITAGLARGDPGVVSDIQAIFANVLRNLPE